MLQVLSRRAVGASRYFIGCTILLVCLLITSHTSAQYPAVIGVYPDSTGTATCAVLPTSELITLHLVLWRHDGVSEITIREPDIFFGTIVAMVIPEQYSWVWNDDYSGQRIDFGGCLPSPTYLATIYLWTDETIDCGYVYPEAFEP